MGFYRGPQIVKEGLVLALDAANVKSYPKSGTNWKDLSGNGNNGTLINGPTFDSGNNGSIVFDGVNDYSDYGNILNLGINNCTINVWLKIDSSWVSGSKYFVSKSRSAAQNYRYAFGFTQTRQLRGFVQGNFSVPDVTPNTITTLNLNQWYMCTMVVNRTSTLDLYINGVFQSVDRTNTISQWNELNFISTNPFRVGSYTAGDNTSPSLVFPGKISSVQMYFRTLTLSEIQQNYNATKTRYGL
jgi:hypothetical protein